MFDINYDKIGVPFQEFYKITRMLDATFDFEGKFILIDLKLILIL